MDYKDTLNLPRTDFPMKADLVAREPARVQAWDQAGLYHQIQARRAGRPKFVLHDGPPFANGDVHIGTALNKILKDFVVRHHSLKGECAPYVPGWDCHGLPIEFKVTQEMRQKGETGSDAASIRRACEAYARKYIDIQRTQFKRLGVLGDWEAPYLTFDQGYEAEELRLFANLVERGFVYRGKKPVYWSIPCRTALAEAEVEYQDHVSPSVYVKFPVVGFPGLFILIWTTTPWTLPANLAVAFNSTFSYSVVRVGAENYVLSTLLLPVVASKCGWSDYEITRSLDAGAVSELEYEHPFCDRRGRVLAGDHFVENTTGTGFVHCAPGHGLEDYHLGLRHGLPVYSPVDDEGRLAHTPDLPIGKQMPAALIGKGILARQGRSEANEAVLEMLRERSALLHQEPHTHSYPHCWRSKTPVIFRAMDQWFIRIDHPVERGEGQASFRKLVLEEIGRVQWIPAWGVNRIRGAIETRPDWCISRQRSWGVPIPAFAAADGAMILDAGVIRRTADLVERQGTNVWFEKSAAELWELVKPPGWSGSVPVAKSVDTLDVWIDSGSSSRAVTGRVEALRGSGANAALPWQADMYLEGSDQHRGWFQSSLLLSLAGNGAAPYRSVLTHGFMVDADREKISKSKQGAYQKPQTSDAYVGKYGADILRLWVASQDFRNDMVVSDERIAKVGEAYRLIRNTLRFQLANLFDFNPAIHRVPDGKLTGFDRWVLGEFAALELAVAAAYEAAEFHVVFQRTSQFAAVELSSIYHDIVKDRLYTDPANSARRRSTQTALHRMVRGLCQMLSPLLVFTTEEAWDFIPGITRGESVHLEEWKPRPFDREVVESALWTRLFQLRDLALPELEKARQAKSIGKALEASVTLRGPADLLPGSEHDRDALRELLNVSQLHIQFDESADAEVSVAAGPAAGKKCGRCWHWEQDVGASAVHAELCGRCVSAIAAA